MTTRQAFIVDVVNHYIKNHPEEYKKVLALIKEKRGKLQDKDLATVKGKQFRVGFRFPQGLYASLDIALDEPRFLELKGESKWFAKKFPQFLIPEEY